MELVDGIVRPRATFADLDDSAEILDQVVVLRDVLPDLGNPRPLDTGFVWKRGIVRLVDGFDGAGLAIFEDTHVG